MEKLHCFILSGGAGTRLWPLSREQFPKQFLDLTHSGKSLFGQTLHRLNGLGELHVVTTKALKDLTVSFLVRESINASIWGEPIGKNTAPAVLLGAMAALKTNPDSICAFFPADHIIEKPELFREAVKAGCDFVEKNPESIVTLGLLPTYPATAYGYIEIPQMLKDLSRPSVFDVVKFIEKPQEDMAKKLLDSGTSFWNAGIILFKAQHMLELFKKFQNDIYTKLSEWDGTDASLQNIYPSLPSISVDYGILEHAKNIKCIPVDIGWSDLGSWEEVARLSPTEEKTLEIESKGNFFLNNSHSQKRTVFVGTQDLVLIDTDDALMVVKKGYGQQVKEAVAALKTLDNELLKSHAFEERPWGRFEILANTNAYKTKKIVVQPGKKLSYQSHAKRAEHWIIVQGEALVTLNDKEYPLKAGQHIHIPLGSKHRMANPGKSILEFIEVQTGTYFGEDDIIRYADDYGRT